MSKFKKLYEKLMAGKSDSNFSFDDLCYLLQKAGYRAETTKGSHILFKKGVHVLNLQPLKGKGKPYQLAQAREDLKKQKINLD